MTFLFELLALEVAAGFFGLQIVQQVSELNSEDKNCLLFAIITTNVILAVLNKGAIFTSLAKSSPFIKGCIVASSKPYIAMMGSFVFLNKCIIKIIEEAYIFCVIMTPWPWVAPMALMALISLPTTIPVIMDLWASLAETIWCSVMPVDRVAHIHGLEVEGAKVWVDLSKATQLTPQFESALAEDKKMFVLTETEQPKQAGSSSQGCFHGEFLAVLGAAGAVFVLLTLPGRF